MDYLWAPDPSVRESQIAEAVAVTPGRDPAMLRARILSGGPAELIDQIDQKMVLKLHRLHRFGHDITEHISDLQIRRAARTQPRNDRGPT